MFTSVVMKRIIPLCLLFFYIFSQPVFAASPYVLPYPSTMPGSSFYKVHILFEKILQYWYFGNFGQFTYNLKESDKYLVEAKTLFEYQQYLLGYSALLKSDQYFLQIRPALIKAEKEGKDISDKNLLLQQAAIKHIEVLTNMSLETPVTFTWRPEKSHSTQLTLHEEIDNAIAIRKKIL